jgi:uncharacterized repeat protein (TIGR01451 family)
MMKELHIKYTPMVPHQKTIDPISRWLKLGIILLVMFAGFSLQAQVNVIVDNVSGPLSPTTGNTVTINHTTGTDANRVMLVGISSRKRTPTSVTLNGNPLTLLVSETGDNDRYTYIYSFLNPPSGSGTVVVTLNSNVSASERAIVGVATFANVNQTTPFPNTNSVRNKNATPNINISSAPGRLVFDVIAFKSQNIIAPASGQTQRWLLNTTSTPKGAASTKPGAATTNMAWTPVASEEWSMSAVDIGFQVGATDLSIEKTVNNVNPTLGQDITFTLTARNLGPNNASGVIVNDLLPNGFTIVGTPVATSGNLQYRYRGMGHWQLNNGVSVTLTIVATVNCAADYKNVATIISNEPDPEKGNNTAVLVIEPQNTIPTVYYLCYGETFDLTSIPTPCNKPSVINVTWHTSEFADASNKIADPTAVTGTPGGTKYYVSFEDPINNCYSPTTEFTIYQNTEIIVNGVKTNVTCNGADNGTITLFVSGGTPGVSPNPAYTYSWTGPNLFAATTKDITGLAPGTYTVTVSDDFDIYCEKEVSFTITEPDALEATYTVKQPSCFEDGSITLLVTGGTAPYTFDWDDLAGANNPQNRLGIPFGTYEVTITDANGCTWTNPLLP